MLQFASVPVSLNTGITITVRYLFIVTLKPELLDCHSKCCNKL